MLGQALIVDDHPLTCQGLRALLLANYPQVLVHVAHTATAARAAFQRLPALDWVFLDINLQDDLQHSLFYELCNNAWMRRTVLISADLEHRLIRVGLANGALGFIPKAANPEQVLAGFAAIVGGEVYLPQVAAHLLPQLSPRLSQVQDQLLTGASNKIIARNLNLSTHTVKEYVSAVLAFHGVANRLELVLKIGAN
jgi:two-component system, NarL family, nitrate/nitrite response regulator NarL